MAVEDFTTYDEIDKDDDIVITATEPILVDASQIYLYRTLLTDTDIDLDNQ